MRILPVMLVSLAISSVSLIARADDPLFSEIPMDAVFASSSTDFAGTPASVTSLGDSRIMGITSLTRALKTAGFMPQKDEQKATISVQYGVNEFVFQISVDPQKDLLQFEVPVRKITSTDPLSLNQMTNLLAAGENDRRMHFAYNKIESEIRVSFRMSTRSVNTATLKATIESIAIFADEHADAWKTNVASVTADSSADSEPSSVAVSTVSQTSSSLDSLVGMWSANVSAGQAFAIQIAADSVFQLVHMSNGKSTVSKGKVTLAGPRLTLAGEGNVSLTGKLSSVTKDAFQLDITGADGKVALALNFKKAN